MKQKNATPTSNKYVHFFLRLTNRLTNLTGRVNTFELTFAYQGLVPKEHSTNLKPTLVNFTALGGNSCKVQLTLNHSHSLSLTSHFHPHSLPISLFFFYHINHLSLTSISYISISLRVELKLECEWIIFQLQENLIFTQIKD